jgi:hypothetical protein
MPSFWTPWQVAIFDPTKKTLDKTFDANFKSDLTAISSQKSQNWNCYERNPTKGRMPKWNKTLSGFQWFIHEPQLVNGLRVMIFGRWGAAENFISVQIAALKEKINSRAVRVGFFP